MHDSHKKARWNIGEGSTAWRKVSTATGNGWSAISSVTKNPALLRVVPLAPKPPSARLTRRWLIERRPMPHGLVEARQLSPPTDEAAFILRLDACATAKEHSAN